MTSPNPLNVYTGLDSLKQYFDPDQAPPLPLVELPPYLNPYYDDGVRIYAKMMTVHPANNVKAMPAMNMLQSTSPSTKTIIEYSSGSTVISMSMVARVMHGITDTRAYLSNKTSLAKLRLMQFFGLDISLFGGPSQPEPYDERGGIQSARRKATESNNGDVFNPNQYENDLNWQSHIRWTGPQIFRQLPEINVLVAGMGTSGTMTGLGTYFKNVKPDVLRLGVCTAPGDRVPGPRSFALMRPVEFPWKEAVDGIEEVNSYDSFSLSLELCRQGIVCGPSSGFNLKGLFQMLERRKSEGRLDELKKDGLVKCVFLCCDLPYQYIGEYFDRLEEGKFHSIKNEELIKVDKHRYDEAWERTPIVLFTHFYAHTPSNPEVLDGLTLRSDCVVLDLRTSNDFSTWHLPSSINIPLRSLNAHTPKPFSSPAVLEKQWLELSALFSDENVLGRLKDQHVLVICYNGDTARVATSILRAKGVEADSLRGGYTALRDQGLWREREAKVEAIVAAVPISA